MLSTFATLRVNSAKHLHAQRDRPFAAAQGDNRGGAASVDAYWRALMVAMRWGVLPVHFDRGKGQGHAPIPGG